MLPMVMQLLKSKIAANAMVIMLLCAGILYFGRYLGLTRMMSMFIVIGILLVFALVMYLKKRKQKKDSDMLETSLKAQGSDSLFGVEDDRKAEVEEIQRKLVTAIETLKKSKLAQGQKGDAALYSLPWYLLLGPPASGKTTMILQSGLEFPLEGGKIRGVGGTRNCDWYFSTSGIFLDTAGRYTTEDDDREEWNGFLDLLKKYRKKKPINGVVVAISVSDLVNRSPEEVEQHAAAIRARLDELIARLGVHFPVYVMFTKLDLIQGCIEFFADMNKKAREQVWGYTLTLEEQRENNQTEIFEREFAKLAGIVERLQLMRLSVPMKREDRRKVYLFPSEFSALSGPLTHFINRLFQYNPFHENPVFRGYYFSSGTQEGTPIDQVIQAIAKQYNLPIDHVDSFEPDQETKSYFIRDTFSDVIIPDRALVTETKKSVKLREKARLVAAGASAIGVVLFMLAVTWGFISSKGTLNNLSAAMEQVQQVEWVAGQRAVLTSNLEKLDNLRAAIEEAESESAFLTLGMSRGSTAAVAARKLFYDRMKDFVQADLFSNLESLIQAYVAGTESGYNSRKVEENLGMYILMGSDDLFGPNVDPPTHTEAVNFLQNELQELVTHLNEQRPQNERLTQDEFARMKRLMAMFGREVRTEGNSRFPSKRNLVESARTRLKANLSSETLYKTSIRQINYRIAGFEPLTLDKIIGPQTQVSSTRKLDLVYYRPVRDSLVIFQLFEKSQNPVSANWILGHITNLPPQLTDRKALWTEYKRLYKEEYEGQWVGMLQSISYNNDAGADQNLIMSAARIREFGNGQSSAVKALIDTLSSQNRWNFATEGGNWLTRAASSVSSIFSADADWTFPDQTKFAGTIRAIHELSSLPNPEEGKPSGGFDKVLEQYSVVATQLEAKAANPEMVVNDVLLQQNIDLAVRSLDVETANRIRMVLMQPLSYASAIVEETIAEEEAGQAQEAWISEVWTEWSAIRTLYPVNPNAADDMSADQFTKFFGPNGTLATFITTTRESVEGNTTPAATATLQKLTQIEESMVQISRNWFAGGVLTGRYRVTGKDPQPLNLVKQVDLKLTAMYAGLEPASGTLYKAVERDFSWPGGDGIAFIEGRDEQNGKDRIEVYPGDFAVFRLLERGQVRRISDREWEARWVVNVSGNSVTLPFAILSNTGSHPLQALNSVKTFQLSRDMF